MYGQPLDLYDIAKAKAWRALWISIGMMVGGLVLGVLGFVTGFIIFIAIALILAGIVKFFTALSLATDPTKKLIHLGPNEVVRRQAFRAAEQDFSAPTTHTFQIPRGGGMLGASWLAYHDNDQLVLMRREDIVWVYPVQKKRERTLRVQVRTGLVMELDEIGIGEGQLLQTFGMAAPHAFFGYNPQVAMTPLPALVYEVDRRRSYAFGQY